MTPLCEVKNLSATYALEGSVFSPAKKVQAVKNVSFTVDGGERVALVGESGSGKSTIAKMLLNLLPPSEGEIFWEGKPAESISRLELAHVAQMIFQDPYASLNPMLKVATQIKEALSPAEKSAEQIDFILQSVGLPSSAAELYPSQFSGGQRQRIAIARALAAHPKLLIADEPVSALDISIQAQILNLLLDLNKKQNIAVLLITHDLAIVKHFCSRVVVLKNGEIVESGPTEQIFQSPQDPYTQKLLSALL